MVGQFSDDTEENLKSPDMKWLAIFLMIQMKSGKPRHEIYSLHRNEANPNKQEQLLWQ